MRALSKFRQINVRQHRKYFSCHLKIYKMGSCWSGASNDDTADKSVSGKDAITEADVKVVAVGRSENLGGQPSKDGRRTLLHARDVDPKPNCEEEAEPFCRLCCLGQFFRRPCCMHDTYLMDLLEKKKKKYGKAGHKSEHDT